MLVSWLASEVDISDPGSNCTGAGDTAAPGHNQDQHQIEFPENFYEGELGKLQITQYPSW